VKNYTANTYLISIRNQYKDGFSSNGVLLSIIDYPAVTLAASNNADIERNEASKRARASGMSKKPAFKLKLHDLGYHSFISKINPYINSHHSIST
jgi:hypothetical protein